MERRRLFWKEWEGVDMNEMLPRSGTSFWE